MTTYISHLVHQLGKKVIKIFKSPNHDQTYKNKHKPATYVS